MMMNNKMIKRFLACLAILLLTSTCSNNQSPKEPSSSSSQVFVGLASFYSGNLKGKETASGSSYDPTEMTAAHRTLPFGTKVLVTNLDNNKSVVVTISDRGPEEKDRIIDVSFAAAQALEMLSAGIVKVRVEVISE
jgi:peptidoglycan lytic transglycosylase